MGCPGAWGHMGGPWGPRGMGLKNPWALRTQASRTRGPMGGPMGGPVGPLNITDNISLIVFIGFSMFSYDCLYDLIKNKYMVFSFISYIHNVERERERRKENNIIIYIYIYIERERR